VKPSSEYLALVARRTPKQSRPGDIWICRRLGNVRVINAHHRGGRRGRRFNDFHLYHFGKPSLYSHPCDWRNDDPNSYTHDPAQDGGRGEKWEYIGNIFDLLPYESLAGLLHR